MVNDPVLASRVRQVLRDTPDLSESGFFNSISFMVRGNMVCGVLGNRLLVHTGLRNWQDAIGQPHTWLFHILGRPLSGYVLVGPEGLTTDEDLRSWVQRGLDFALGLSPR
jgi:hypothetical protein